jgi:hypothetical protein
LSAVREAFDSQVEFTLESREHSLQ